MQRRLAIIIVGIIFFFLFVFFSYLVHEDLFTQLDFNTTVRLQDNVPRRVDTVFSFLSDVGKFEISLLILIVLLVFIRKIWAGLLTISLFAGFHIIELFGKLFVDHPPPPQFMLRTHDVFAFPEFHVRSEFSYPSGHSGRAIFLSVVLLVFILQQKRLPLWAKVVIVLGVLGYDGLMLLSRVYLGEHWMTDVIGGALLGLSFGLLCAAFLLRMGKHEKWWPKKFFPKYKIEIKKIGE